MRSTSTELLINNSIEYMNRERERVERVGGDGRVKERGHRLKVEFCHCFSVPLPPPCITIFCENEENEDSRNQKMQLFF